LIDAVSVLLIYLQQQIDELIKLKKHPVKEKNVFVALKLKNIIND
jgi:hypothetical protein